MVKTRYKRLKSVKDTPQKGFLLHKCLKIHQSFIWRFCNIDD